MAINRLSRHGGVIITAVALSGFSFQAIAFDRAASLHETCKAAASAPNSVVVTDSDTECVFRTDAGNGHTTFYNYYSGDDFCTRAVLVSPGSPNFDRTFCQPMNDPEGRTTSEIADVQKRLGMETIDEDQALRFMGTKVDYIEGTVNILRETKTMPMTAEDLVEPGDVVLTGKAGFVDLISSGDTVWLSGDSTMGLAEIGTVEGKEVVIAPDEPLDPQTFQLDELSWWDKLMVKVTGTYNPDIEKTAEMYGQPRKARILYRGSAYFEDRAGGPSPSPFVITPTAAIVPTGTSFLVDVKDNGDTTVTTLDGKVTVMDMRSGSVTTVSANQKLTVPKTDDGLSARQMEDGVSTTLLQPMDRWWLDKMNAKSLMAAIESEKAGRAANSLLAEKIDERKAIMAAIAMTAVIIGVAIATSRRGRNPGKK